MGTKGLLAQVYCTVISENILQEYAIGFQHKDIKQSSRSNGFIRNQFVTVTTTQKIKFSIKDFCSKCDQIPSF